MTNCTEIQKNVLCCFCRDREFVRECEEVFDPWFLLAKYQISETTFY